MVVCHGGSRWPSCSVPVNCPYRAATVATGPPAPCGPVSRAPRTIRDVTKRLQHGHALLCALQRAHHARRGAPRRSVSRCCCTATLQRRSQGHCDAAYAPTEGADRHWRHVAAEYHHPDRCTASVARRMEVLRRRRAVLRRDGGDDCGDSRSWHMPAKAAATGAHHAASSRATYMCSMNTLDKVN